MNCPNCKAEWRKSNVVDGRDHVRQIAGVEIPTFRRFRKCECGERYPTIELSEDDLIEIMEAIESISEESARGWAVAEMNKKSAVQAPAKSTFAVDVLEGLRAELARERMLGRAA